MKKHKLKHSLKAFSLVELSIVTIIIGVLISGIISGKDLLYKMRLQGARSMTTGSDAGTIEGLMLWFDSSSEGSFDESQTADGADFTISTPWYDINPQSSTKLYALTESTSGLIYKRKGIGGLPSIYFPKTSSKKDFFEVSTKKDVISSISMPTRNNAFTVFTVSKKFLAGPSNKLFYNGDLEAENGWGYKSSGGGLRTMVVSGDYHDGGSTTASAEIKSITFEGKVGGALKLYINGTLDADMSTTTTVSSPLGGGFFIGAFEVDDNVAWRGEISEIIFYGRSLDDEDRKDVEKYLSKKYSIKLTS